MWTRRERGAQQQPSLRGARTLLTAFEDVDLPGRRPVGTKHLFRGASATCRKEASSGWTHPECRPSATPERRARQVGDDKSSDVEPGVRSDTDTVPESSGWEPRRIVDRDDGLSSGVDVRKTVRSRCFPVDVPATTSERVNELGE